MVSACRTQAVRESFTPMTQFAMPACPYELDPGASQAAGHFDCRQCFANQRFTGMGNALVWFVSCSYARIESAGRSQSCMVSKVRIHTFGRSCPARVCSPHGKPNLAALERTLFQREQQLRVRVYR